MERLKEVRKKISVEKEPNSYDLNPSEPIFTARYLGNASVKELFNPSNGYTLCCRYTEQLLKEKKRSLRNPRKMELLISQNIERGVLLSDPTGKLPEQTFQLQNIAFCTTLKQHPKVFSFIAEQAGKLECNVFLCSKEAKARAMCIAVTKAFTVAHTEWSKKKDRQVKKKERRAIVADVMVNVRQQDGILSDQQDEEEQGFTHEQLQTDEDLKDLENCSDVMMLVRGDRSASEATDTSLESDTR